MSAPSFSALRSGYTGRGIFQWYFFANLPPKLPAARIAKLLSY